MTLAVTEEPAVASLPPASATRPPSMDSVTPLREALGLAEEREPAVVMQARALADAHPGSPVALARLAQAAQSVGRQDLACRAARDAIAVAGDSPSGSAAFAVRAAGLILAAAGAPDAAEALSRDGIPGAALVRAGLAAEAGDKATALSLIANETGALALSMRGWLLLDSDPGRAVASFRAAAREGLRSPDVLINLGYGLGRLGSISKAVRATREATRIAPYQVAAAYNLCFYLHREGKNAEALSEINRIADARPNDADLALRRDWAYVHFAQDERAALRQLQNSRHRLRSILSESERAEFESSIAYLSYKVGRLSLESARKALWQRLDASGPGREVVRMLARLNADPGDVAALKELLEKAGDVLSPSQLQMQRSRVAGWEGRLSEAVALARQAVESDPADPEVLGSAIYVIGEEGGNYDLAARLSDQADNGILNDPMLANNVALAFALSGQPGKAARVVARAGGAAALPFGGATSALVSLAAGRIREGVAGYARAVQRLQNEDKAELASLVDWRRRLAMAQLRLPLPEDEDLEEPAGRAHTAARVALRLVKGRLPQRTATAD
jgi:tetratricopeptide (TPR) repeat protein